jgi:hypothetical protein
MFLGSKRFWPHISLGERYEVNRYQTNDFRVLLRMPTFPDLRHGAETTNESESRLVGQNVSGVLRRIKAHCHV